MKKFLALTMIFATLFSVVTIPAAATPKTANGYTEAEDTYGAVATAQVIKLNGNQNGLTITITLAGNVIAETYEIIQNNSAGEFAVGEYRVYVSTYGNDKIDLCFITYAPEPEPEPDKPEIGKLWMLPKGNSFNELFKNLDQWTDTQSKVDVIGFADHVLWRSYESSERRAGFAAMKEMGIPLALEVGAIKGWGFNWLNAYHKGDPEKMGLAMFEDQNSNYWTKFISEGAEIKGFAFDEPLVAVLEDSAFNFLGNTQAKFNYAVEQTAQFVKNIRENYPDAVIGDIEVFPHYSADYVISWIQALEKRLIELTGKGQDFFRLDVNWADNRTWNFRSGNVANSGWSEVKRIEDYCKSIGLPFSLIYWAPDYSGYDAKDRSTDKLWYDQIMAQGSHYLAAGGSPDQYVVQTWIQVDGFWLPYTNIPETTAWSFTNSVVDLYNTYIAPVSASVSAENPGDFTEWMNIGFDISKDGWNTSTRLTMKIGSDENNYRLYDVTKYVHKPENSVIIPLDAFTMEEGMPDFSNVAYVTFEVTAGPAGASFNISRMALFTPKTGKEDDEPEPGETLPISDGGGVRQFLPRSDTFFSTLIYNTLADPADYGKSINFEEWTYLEFDVYVGDYDAFKASGNEIRVKVGSPTEQQVAAGEDPDYFYPGWESIWHEKFNNLPHYHDGLVQYAFNGKIPRSGWTHVRIPIVSTSYGPFGNYDKTSVRTLWFYLENNGAPIANTSFEIKNIYLSGKIETEDEDDCLYLFKDTKTKSGIDLQTNSVLVNNETRFNTAVDFSVWKYIELDIYIEDLDDYKSSAPNNLRMKISSNFNDTNAQNGLYFLNNYGVLDENGWDNGWKTIRIPIGDVGHTDVGFDMKQIRSLSIYIESDAPAINVNKSMGVGNIKLTGEPDPVSLKPDMPAETADTLYLANELYQSTVSASGETKFWEHWPNLFDIGSQWVKWPSGVDKPTDFSDWEFIEFYFYADELPQQDLRFRLVSKMNIDEDRRIYSFKDAIWEPVAGYPNWWNIKLPLDTFIYEDSTFDLSNVNGTRFWIENDGNPLGFDVKLEVGYIRLTGKQSPPPPESETLAIYSNTAETTFGPTNEKTFLTLWPAGDLWDADVARPVDFTEWNAIEFEFYIDSKSGLTGYPDNELRMIIVSGSDIDNNANIYAFSDAVLAAGFTAGIGVWQKITVPLSNIKYPDIGGTCDMQNISGIRFKLQPEGSNAFEVTLGIRNVKLTR